MKNIVSIVLLFLIFQNASLADEYWNDNYKKAYNAALRMEFSKADSILKIENYSNRVIDSYVRAHSFFSKFYLNFYEESTAKNSDTLSNYLEIIENHESNNPWYYYIKAEVEAMNSIILASEKSNFKSVLNIYRSNKTVKSKIEEFPDFDPLKNLYGIQLCAFSAIPDDFKAIAALFGVDGSVERGIELLKNSSESKNPENKFMNDKFMFTYVFCEREFNNEKSNIPELIKSYKEYPFLVYYQANYLQKKGDTDQAISLLLQSEKNWKKNFNFLNYYTGRTLSFKLDPRSDSYLHTFLKNSENMKFRAGAYKYLAYNRLVVNDSNGYQKYITKINSLNYQKLLNSDKAAYDEANLIKNKRLIESSLLYEGGYLNMALNKIIDYKDSICIDNISSLTYNYRLASIYKKQKKYKQAEELFIKCSEFPFENKLHYQANSLLMLAEIYFELEKYQTAMQYSDLCLNIGEEYPFKQEIKIKSKALQRKIEKKI